MAPMSISIDKPQRVCKTELRRCQANEYNLYLSAIDSKDVLMLKYEMGYHR